MDEGVTMCSHGKTDYCEICMTPAIPTTSELPVNPKLGVGRTAVPAAEEAADLIERYQGICDRLELADWADDALSALESLAAENAKLREIDAMRIETVRYTFQQLSLIVPDDDDNRPLEAHARMAVAAHAALAARCEKAEVEARRYQWVRGASPSQLEWMLTPDIYPGFIDAQIDAALASQGTAMGEL